MKEKETIEYLDLKSLVPFRNHPFKLRDGEEKEQLLQSIRTQGAIEPLIVRPLSESEYEVISGHRRMEVYRELGIEKLPVIVRNLTDEQAVSMMADANLHRENILPSERAFAYKMKWEAAKKSEKTLSQPATRIRNDDVIAQSFGIGKDTLHRYIRLTCLIPELLDTKRLKATKSSGISTSLRHKSSERYSPSALPEKARRRSHGSWKKKRF